MLYSKIVAAASIAVVSTSAVAGTPLVLHPEQIGAETARYFRGKPSIQLKTPAGTVEVRPMPVRNGELTFQIAVFNTSGQAGNFGTENVTAVVDGAFVHVPSYDQLVDRAEQRARQAKLSRAALGAGLALLASGASSHGTYYRHVGGPVRGYTRAIHWEDNTPGVVGAAVATAGTMAAIRGVDAKLDHTLERLGGEMLQTTTVDPESSFGGTVVVPVGRRGAPPAHIRLQVTFNGVNYPFAFRLAPAGAMPAPLPATARGDQLPDEERVGQNPAAHAPD